MKTTAKQHCKLLLNNLEALDLKTFHPTHRLCYYQMHRFWIIYQNNCIQYVICGPCCLYNGAPLGPQYYRLFNCERSYMLDEGTDKPALTDLFQID